MPRSALARSASRARGRRDDRDREDELDADDGGVDAARGDERLGKERPVEDVAEVAVGELACGAKRVREQEKAEGDANGAEDVDVAASRRASAGGARGITARVRSRLSSVVRPRLRGRSAHQDVAPQALRLAVLRHVVGDVVERRAGAARAGRSTPYEAKTRASSDARTGSRTRSRHEK